MELKAGDRIRVLKSDDEPRLDGATGTMENVKGWGLCMKLDERREGFMSGYSYIYPADKVEVIL